MAKSEQERAKELFLQGFCRSEVEPILRKEFKDKSINSLKISITRAAKEIVTEDKNFNGGG